MINGKQKGKRGELELCEFLRALGVEARRGVLYTGGTDSPDVITDFFGVHFECKRVEKGNLYDWLDQAINDAGSKLPVVAHKRNRRDWVAVIRLDDLVRLLQRDKIHGDKDGDTF